MRVRCSAWWSQVTQVHLAATYAVSLYKDKQRTSACNAPVVETWSIGFSLHHLWSNYFFWDTNGIKVWVALVCTFFDHHSHACRWPLRCNWGDHSLPYSFYSVVQSHIWCIVCNSPRHLKGNKLDLILTNADIIHAWSNSQSNSIFTSLWPLYYHFQYEVW